MIIASPVMKHFPLERRRAPLRDKMRCRTVCETSDSECFSWILAMHLISGDMHSVIRIFIKNDHALNDCPDKLLTFFDPSQSISVPEIHRIQWRFACARILLAVIEF
ncbi:hypothetical protein CDAR_230461 [Caerostris darwini]|uniref:Uncharacterized protein n=1 Tax=Caerostris darwini TaxID=1538125 RepID=A0AAV4RX97_9ARAC|nr:hypothetical protein CDAR_230461 [Caerostris darwini]